MRIRSYRECLIWTLAALGAVACSERPGDTPDVLPDDSKDAVYMNVTVQLPTGRGSRSETQPGGGSDDGIEIGKDYENEVNSVLLVLADKNNKFIACAEKSESLKKESDGKVTAVQSISKSTLSTYYGGDNGTLADNEIHVFVFCNPTLHLKNVFSTTETEGVRDDWYDAVCSIAENPDGSSDNATIWGGPDHKGGFLMSSYEVATKYLPKKFSDWEDFTSADTPFLLSGINRNIGGESDNEVDNVGDTKNGGAIKVERSVARFDFKDGSKGDNTYDVVKDPEDDSKYIMRIQLQKMALVNMSKNFYYLRRVSDNGLGKSEANANNFALCGTETDKNYVVDTDASVKSDGSIITGKTYGDYFNFCLGSVKNGNWAIDPDARNQWYTSGISDILTPGIDDNDNDWNSGHTKGDYKIWRYVTENTIPNIDRQQIGITTGVVFKGKMIAVEGVSGTLADALNGATGDAANDPILYVYGNEIFVTWKEVRAKALADGRGGSMYTAVFGDPENADELAVEDAEGKGAVYSADTKSADYKWNAWHNGEKDDAMLKVFKAAATGGGFTLYQSSMDGNVPGYYCYYFYWNRHNDNGNNGVMGPMEFGVVRNNVYKLSVTNIRRLGHPRVSENDPDPVDPDDPDEEGDVYLSVSVEVLPWVVRINDIEF